MVELYQQSACSLLFYIYYRLYEAQVHKVVKIQSLMRAFLARKKSTRLAASGRQGSVSQQNSVDEKTAEAE